MPEQRVLLVDLNNYARYPTLSIGYLVASLRRAGFAVELLSPLSYGVPATEREHQETAWDQLQRRVYLSTHPLVVRSHDLLRASRARWLGRPDPRVVEETARALRERRPDVLLLSAYLEHYPSVVRLAAIAADHRVPVLLGGPMFNLPDVAREWLGIPGLTAVVGAESDLTLPALVEAAIAGDDLDRQPGVFLPDGRHGPPAPPLENLEDLPLPDFSDFPWDRYPNRVVPVMTGRGCSWGRCLFCGDVRTVNGRTFRSRPVEAVLEELEEQGRRYGTRDVIFLDIKLNSDLEMWHGILEGFQRRLPGGRWIGTVHVQAGGENGLSREELAAAGRAGMVRTTFGLETGSQRVNDSMAKGTSLDAMSAFLHGAHAAGISVRTTMMLGFPGEQAADVRRSSAFLAQHRHLLDRVRLTRFKAIPGTRFHARYRRRPERYATMRDVHWNLRYARASYRYVDAEKRSYRRAKTELLRLVHAVNRRPLRPGAEAFDGLM